MSLGPSTGLALYNDARMPRLPARAWWFPVVFALHNLEEALWLPEWSSDAAPFHGPVAAGSFRFAVAALTALAVAATAFARTRGGVAAHVAVGAWVMMLGNVVAPHLLATVALGRYAPGLATGVALLVPVLGWLLVAELRDGHLSLGRALADGAGVTAVVVPSLPGLFALGRLLGLEG